MKETRADVWAPVFMALGLHALLFALLFAGLRWTRSHVAEAARGEVIEADLVDPSALSAAMRSALQRTPEQPQPPAPEPEPPLPQPIVEDSQPPAPVPDPEPVEQEKVQRDADSPEVAQVPREQEQKRRQPEQVDLDAQKQRQLEEIRKQRELAARERTQAEMRAQQLADARASQTDASSTASPPRGNPNSRSTDNALYSVAVKDAITRQWIRPESIPLGVPCQVRIRQIPGGEVVDVQVSGNCPYDETGKESLRRAVLKASPLPYAGFEDVFNRDVILTFRPEDVDDLQR